MKLLGQKTANIFCKEPNSKIFSLVGRIVATLHPCHCSLEAAIDNLRIQGHGCVSVELYYYKHRQHAGFSLWAIVFHLPF